MPNTKVRLVPALVGGVVAGTAWQAAFWLYTTLQIGMARYNAIYGAFAALPVFMTWLYVSWAVVLFGAEVSRATQDVK
jgi:membrane protein